jgi:hypothetical protein
MHINSNVDPLLTIKQWNSEHTGGAMTGDEEAGESHSYRYQRPLGKIIGSMRVSDWNKFGLVHAALVLH